MALSYDELVEIEEMKKELLQIELLSLKAFEEGAASMDQFLDYKNRSAGLRARIHAVEKKNQQPEKTLRPQRKQ